MLTSVDTSTSSEADAYTTAPLHPAPSTERTELEGEETTGSSPKGDPREGSPPPLIEFVVENELKIDRQQAFIEEKQQPQLQQPQRIDNGRISQLIIHGSGQETFL